MKEIGLIEDDKTLRDTYVRYFKSAKLFKTVFSVDDIADATSLVMFQPEIILLDINLPSGSGIDGISSLKRHFPDTKIVMLSSMQDAALTRQALDNGAIGYLLKSSSLAYIGESLSKIDEGGIPFSPGTFSHVIQPPNTEPAEVIDFTKRELELIELLSKGVANKTAAGELNVTYFTINQHLKNIYKKLQINSKPELISWFFSKNK